MKQNNQPEPPKQSHQSIIDLYETAARSARHSVFLTPPGEVIWPRWLARRHLRLFHFLKSTWIHLWTVHLAWTDRTHELILVRDFTTLVLGVLAPLFWRSRQKLAFIVHHNLQSAHDRLLDRFILKSLCRCGFRFVLLEALDGLRELSVVPNPKQFLVLPLPIVRMPDVLFNPGAGPPTIGIIGNFRAEKQVDLLLRLLLEAYRSGQLSGRLLLGTPNRKLRSQWATITPVVTRDTSHYSDYMSALAECDVIVIHYEASRYYYRSSGIIADAGAFGVAVVCPNFPILRAQVTRPAPIGAVFEDVQHIVTSIRAATELRRSTASNFRIWAEARNLREIAARLDLFIEGNFRPIRASTPVE